MTYEARHAAPEPPGAELGVIDAVTEPDFADEQLQAPEYLSVQRLTANARDILDTPATLYETEEDGSQVRTYQEGTYGPRLIERVDSEGKISYGFSYTVGHEVAKAAVSHVWVEGGSEVHAQFQGMSGVKYDTLLDNKDEIDGVQQKVDLLSAPADTTTSYHGPLPDGMIGRLRAGQGSERDREGLLDARPNRYPQRESEGSRERDVHYETLERATAQIETLIEDPTVKWKTGRREPNKRTTQTVLPDERPGYSNVAAEITVIDEPDKPRWYVVLVKSPNGASRVVTWSKGRERALTRAADVSEYRPADIELLGLAANATDPEKAHIARKPPEISPERYAELTRTQRLANRIGRLLGRRDITGFW